MGWEAARSCVPNKPHADRRTQPKCTAESFLKPEGGIARGSFSPYPQGGPKAPPPSQTPRCGEAVAIMDAIDRSRSRLDFGWVFALYLPKDFDREKKIEAEKEFDQSTALRQERLHLCWRSRNRFWDHGRIWLAGVPGFDLRRSLCHTSWRTCKSVTRGALDLVQAYSEAAETWLGNDLHSRRQSQGLVFFDSGVTAAFQIKWSMGTPCRPSFATIASFGRKMVVC